MTDAAHAPVLLGEALKALAPARGETFVDATFGAGGYSRAILSAAACVVHAFDRDPDARKFADDIAAREPDRFQFHARPFDEMEEALAGRNLDKVDGVVFDIGVSSMQLDDAARGFSFRLDGPLSMRMDQGAPDAADLVNRADADDLAAIFRAYGEEPAARRIARAIVAARADKAIMTTAELAHIIARAAPAHPAEKTHPATRAFQALRIFVNDELGQLARGLLAAERLLRPAGRLVVVTFHSLEDRVVKRFIAERSGAAPAPSRHAPVGEARARSFQALAPKPIVPSAAEVSANPRARSAKLRAAVRLDAPANDARSFMFQPPRLSPTLMTWR